MFRVILIPDESSNDNLIFKMYITLWKVKPYIQTLQSCRPAMNALRYAAVV